MIFKYKDSPLINKTRNEILTKRICICDNFFSQSIGLMFRKSFPEDTAFIFVFNKDVQYSIHSFFVFFPFLLILLDKNKRVIKKYKVKPFDVIFPSEKYRYFIELPLELNDKVLIDDILEW